MALNDISLTASMRSNLISLQNTSTLLSRTQDRLSTGKKVNTALDNPTNFFAAQSHTQRAADLSVRKDGMLEAVQGVQAANKGITAITSLIEAAKGLTQAARSADTSNRNSLAIQFNTILSQISQMASDSGYKGKNFVTGDTLDVLFNENGISHLNIVGFTGTATGLALSNVTEAAAAQVTAGTDAAASGVTAINSGNLSGASTTVNITTHTATLASGVGFVATGQYFASNTGVMAAAVASGDYISLTGFAQMTGFAGLDTGAITINAVYIDGVATGVNTVVLTGASGAFNIQLDADEATFYTGASVTFDLTIAGHASNGSLTATNMTVFNLAAGDVGSGISVLDGAPGANGTGAVIMVSGSFVATGSAWVSGDQLIFTGIAVPPAAGVTYSYNTGFVAGSTVAARTMSDLIYTGDALSAGQAITEVRINGTAINSGYYTIAGNVVTFSGAAVLDNLLHSGDTIGLTTKTESFTFTIADTLATGQTIDVDSVNIGGTYLTGFVTVNGSDITIDSGAFTAGLINSGDTISFSINTAGVGGGWSGDAGIDASVNGLNTAIEKLRTQSASLASNLSVVTIRQDFTDGMINTLLKGADNLTLADMNEEGANMLMLQTRQQLGTTSLKMASDAAQSVLRLF